MQHVGLMPVVAPTRGSSYEQRKDLACAAYIYATFVSREAPG